MTSTSRAVSAPVIRIQPTRGWAALDLHELWAYRELLYFLVWRDVKVRSEHSSNIRARF